MKTLPLWFLVAAFFVLCPAASAQKVLADSGSYTHNWNANHNNLDAANGAYVYFFTNQTIGGGPPTLGDNVRKCWRWLDLSGGQTSIAPHAANWVCVVQGTNATAGPHVGQVTVVSLADPQGGSDVCIAPFTANPIWIVGGFFFNFGFLNLTPGFWIIGFEFIGGGPGMPGFGHNNANTCLEGRMVYELQHGYNGTANNQQYLHVVSIDEVTHPDAGGVSEGDPGYGQNEWGPVVGPGNVVSFSRFISFSGNAIFLLGGQTIEGNGDGLELDLAVAFNIPASQPGRENGVTDCNGVLRMDFGAGGSDWVSCATSGLPGNNFSIRTVDYYYAQLGDPASIGYKQIRCRVCTWWSETKEFPCKVNNVGTGTTGLPLDFGIQFDSTTTLFLNSTKAQADATYSSEFKKITGSVFGALWVDGCWPSYCTDGVFLGQAELPTGAARRLSLCHSKARKVFTSGDKFYFNKVVQCYMNGSWENDVETGTSEYLPIK